MRYQFKTIDPSPFKDWGIYASKDSDRVVITNCGMLVGFHVTTVDGAKGILDKGPKAFDCPVGFNGRSIGPAFWLNNVPWLPYGLEGSDPKFHRGVDMAVVIVHAPLKLIQKPVIESTWPFLQWGIQGDDVLDLEIVRTMDPHEMLVFRSAECWRDMHGWCREALEEKYCPQDGFISEIFK